jgi:hypothetical protein
VRRFDLLLRAERAGRWIPSGWTTSASEPDAPPLKPLKKAGVDIIKSLKLSPADKAKLSSQNASRLLKI